MKKTYVICALVTCFISILQAMELSVSLKQQDDLSHIELINILCSKADQTLKSYSRGKNQSIKPVINMLELIDSAKKTHDSINEEILAHYVYTRTGGSCTPNSSGITSYHKVIFFNRIAFYRACLAGKKSPTKEQYESYLLNKEKSREVYITSKKLGLDLTYKEILAALPIPIPQNVSIRNFAKLHRNIIALSQTNSQTVKELVHIYAKRPNNIIA